MTINGTATITYANSDHKTVNRFIVASNVRRYAVAERMAQEKQDRISRFGYEVVSETADAIDFIKTAPIAKGSKTIATTRIHIYVTA